MSFDTREFEFADVKVKVLGANLSGLRGLTYKKSQDKAPLYAQGNKPKSIQRGNKKYDGTLHILKSDLDALDTAAVAAGYEDITDVPAHLIFLTVVYKKDDNQKMLCTENFIGVEFTEYEDGMKQGEQFKEISLPWIALNRTKVSG